MYAKLIDEKLVIAPPTLIVGDKVHYHPSPELYAERGWMPVIETPEPEQSESDSKYYVASWKFEDGKIIRVWVESEAPASSAVRDLSVAARVSALEEAVLAIMGGELFV